MLRWSQTVIDLADGDPRRATSCRVTISARVHVAGSARLAWVVPDGATTCGTAWPWPAAPTRCPTPRSSPTSTSGIAFGVLRPDDSALREIDDALRIAERSGDDLALDFARLTLGVALVHRQTAAERDRGEKLLAEVGEVHLRRRILCDLPIVDVYLAREKARRGDRDEAIPLLRAAVDDLFREGQLLAWGLPATGVLVETLLDRAPTVTWPKPTPRSTGWRPRQPTRAGDP